MPVLLTVLTIGAAVALLALLMFGLLLIFKPLESIREQLERITLGVRAIERQTENPARIARELDAALAELESALESAATRIAPAASEPAPTRQALREALRS